MMLDFRALPNSGFFGRFGGGFPGFLLTWMGLASSGKACSFPGLPAFSRGPISGADLSSSLPIFLLY
jgi:hypothetical protein